MTTILRDYVAIPLDGGDTQVTIHADGRVTWSPPHRSRARVVDSLGRHQARLLEQLDVARFALAVIREE